MPVPEPKNEKILGLKGIEVMIIFDFFQRS
jgi:hypothetical protein